jgi:hypothetical protein
MVPFLLVLGLAGVGAQSTPTPTPSPNPARTAVPSLDPDCVRFDDPTAVVNGEIVFAGYTAYRFALDHAVAAWSPERGFAVPFREAVPTDATVPPEANLIYRDVRIPGSGFKGVTVTWSHAPATVTLNLAALPPPETADPRDQERLLAVVTHETGHALGLGDVPTPGVNIRECANMLMKRSVDKGGGAFTEPQPGDIALYCMRWSAPICGNRPLPSVSPNPAPIAPPGPHPPWRPHPHPRPTRYGPRPRIAISSSPATNCPRMPSRPPRWRATLFPTSHPRSAPERRSASCSACCETTGPPRRC